MNTLLSRAACRLAACLGALLLNASLASSQVVHFDYRDPSVFGADRFRSLGIDSEGGIWIVGDRDNGFERGHVLFHFTGNEFESMPLLPLPGADNALPGRISRDGQHVIGRTLRDGFDEPTLWARSESLVPKSLGTFLENSRTQPWDVASTATGPLVVGRYPFGTFFWSEHTGYRAWMTNSEFWPFRETCCISADGTKWAGQHYSLSGTQLFSAPFVGTEAGIKVMDTGAAAAGAVVAISPNGEHLVGRVGSQVTTWTKKKARALSFGTNLFFLGAITDRGFAGGASSLGGVIYDSHGSKVELFDEWWATKFRAAPLPAHVRRVRDLQEHAGDIYCLIDLENQDTGYVTSALAIAPLKQGKKK